MARYRSVGVVGAPRPGNLSDTRSSGCVLSTALTLFVVPVAYILLDRMTRESRAGAGDSPWRQTDAGPARVLQLQTAVAALPAADSLPDRDARKRCAGRRIGPETTSPPSARWTTPCGRGAARSRYSSALGHLEHRRHAHESGGLQLRDLHPGSERGDGAGDRAYDCSPAVRSSPSCPVGGGPGGRPRRRAVARFASALLTSRTTTPSSRTRGGGECSA